MALWHCGVYGAAHPVLRVSAVRERVRGVRFVVLCPRFVCKQCSAPSALVSLHALAISTFAAEKSPSRSACGARHSLHGFIYPTTPPRSVRFGHGSCFGETAF